MDAGATDERGWHRWAVRAGHWLAMLGLYRLLVGPNGWPEWAAGAVCATIATGGIAAVRAQEDRPRPGLGAVLWVAGRVVGPLVADGVRVFGALARGAFAAEPIAGRELSIPFDPGGDDQASMSRRALVVAGLSLPPNAFVVAVDVEGRRLILHQLVAAPGVPGGGDRGWPL